MGLQGSGIPVPERDDVDVTLAEGQTVAVTVWRRGDF